MKMSRYLRPRRSDGYSPVPNDDSGFSDAQFEAPPEKIPWKAIGLSAFLCGGGTITLIAGCLIATGYLDNKHYEKMWPVIVLGLIMMVPGAYHMRIAYCAFRGYPGYSFSDIPELE